MARHRSQMAFNGSSDSAVGENTCASPVHPSRSSRCGQSVGTSTKLPFCPQENVVLSLVDQGLRGFKLAGGRLVPHVSIHPPPAKDSAA